MHRLRTRKPSPALAVAFVALLVALGGTSYAAFSLPKNSVGTKQLKDNAVTTSKIKDGAVTSSKLNTSGLTVPHAANANNATHATTADRATVGGPVAFAAVNLNGTVDPDHSRGIDSSNVTTAGISSYCFKNLPWFKFALSSVRVRNERGAVRRSDIGGHRLPQLPGPRRGVPDRLSGRELEVTVGTTGRLQRAAFSIALYN